MATKKMMYGITKNGEYTPCNAQSESECTEHGPGTHRMMDRHQYAKAVKARSQEDEVNAMASTIRSSMLRTINRPQAPWFRETSGRSGTDVPSLADAVKDVVDGSNHVTVYGDWTHVPSHDGGDSYARKIDGRIYVITVENGSHAPSILRNAGVSTLKHSAKRANSNRYYRVDVWAPNDYREYLKDGVHYDGSSPRCLFMTRNTNRNGGFPITTDDVAEVINANRYGSFAIGY